MLVKPQVMDEFCQSFQGLTFDDHPYVCPKCFNPCLNNANWCSSCGEFLIGAGLCSTNIDYKADTSSGKEVISNIPASHTPFVCDHSGIHYLPNFTCACGTQFQNCLKHPQQPVLSLSPESFFDATFINPSAFLLANVKQENASWDETSPRTIERIKPSYVKEDTVSLINQAESDPHCNDLSYKTNLNIPTNTLSYTEGSTENGITSCVPRYNSGLSKIAYSYPRSGEVINQINWNSGDYNGYHMYRRMGRLPDGRQRCISGPTREIQSTSTQIYTSKSTKPQSSHSRCGLMSYIQTPPLQNGRRNQEINSSQNLSFEHSDDHMVNNITSAYSFPIENSYEQRGIHRIQSCNFPMVYKNMESGLHTTGSCGNESHDCLGWQFISNTRLSSDHNCVDKVALDTNYCVTTRPQYNWKSARIAWSVRDPALLKKKPAAYLRASYNQIDPGFGQFESKTTFQEDTENLNSQQYTITSSDPTQELTTFKSGRKKLKRSGKQKFNRIKKHNKWVTSSATTAISTVPMYESKKYAKRKNTNLIGRLNQSKVDSPNHDECTNNDNEIESFHSPEQNPNWLSLPDELWLFVIRPLCPADRANLALTCRRLSRLTMDRSLWRVIHLHRQHNLTDESLLRIGNLRPKELRLTYCHGDSLTAAGLRRMFFVCGFGLQKLSFIGCTKGPFDHDLPLRLVADHCPNLKHVNASYTQAVRDQTVIALAKSASHLISVKLNGAQQISNNAIQQLVHYHKKTLERLELFGCFRLNSNIFTLLGHCENLRALAFGHLHHLSSDGLLELVGKLPHLSSLDLRGTQTLGDDDDLPQLAAKCPQLEEVVLANMNSLKRELGIVQMLHKLPYLRVLDLCGLAAVGDSTMKVLATSCLQIEQLDVSCTSVTQKGLAYLTDVPAVCLRCIRISRCREINKDVLEKLIRACPKLNILYAYGFITIQDWSFLRKIRSTLVVESGI